MNAASLYISIAAKDKIKQYDGTAGHDSN